MPLFLDSGYSRAALESNAADCVRIGLINNMPDAAVEATERQFTDLIRAAMPNMIVILKLFAIPELPRAADMRLKLGERYSDIAELWDTPLDGLIVTGTEPRTAKLTDEPYWQTLSKVVDWAREHTASAIWSCLAAHAAVLHADGIERRALKEKCFGVFDCRLVADHPMTQRFPQPFWLPHSRYNGLAEQELAAAGYKILTGSAMAGVDIFAKHNGSFFLFFQGHPEYDADSLLREYRRDAARFLAGERDQYPAMPHGYFDDDAVALAETFRARALADRRSVMIANFPKIALEAGLKDLWRPAAVGIYETWAAYLVARKAQHRPVRIPLRRTWRDWPIGITAQPPTPRVRNAAWSTFFGNRRGQVRPIQGEGT